MRVASSICLLAIVPCLGGCQQKMAVQPSFKPLDPDSFFQDGQSARLPVTGTVARGHLRTDLALFTGRRTPETRDWTQPAAVVGAAAAGVLGVGTITAGQQDQFVTDFPFPITRQVLQHGHDRFMIYCVVCHDPLGTGRGKIVERGYTAPPSYHIDRLRAAPVGYLFGVITNGYGSMPSYAGQVPPPDRWAIVAYVRALQLSQHFPAKELPESLRQERDEMSRATPAGGQR